MISNNRDVGVIAFHAPLVTGPVCESSVMLRTEEHFGIRMKMLSPEEVFQHHNIRPRKLWILLREVLLCYAMLLKGLEDQRGKLDTPSYRHDGDTY